MAPLDEIPNRFRDHLLSSGKSSHTIEAYIRDLRLFSKWFLNTNGKPLTPQSITPIDVREYRSRLLNVKGYKCQWQVLRDIYGNLKCLSYGQLKCPIYGNENAPLLG